MDIYLTSSIRREELVQRLGEMAGQDPSVPQKVEPESELSVEGSPKMQTVVPRNPRRLGKT
jgi:hypothetical protein